MYKVVRYDFCSSLNCYIEVSVVTFVDSKDTARRIVDLLASTCVYCDYSFGYLKLDEKKYDEK